MAANHARCPKLPPGSASAANTTPKIALRRYSSCPIAQKTTSGTSKTSRTTTARGQLIAAGLSWNTFDSQLAAFPPWTGGSSCPVALAMVTLAFGDQEPVAVHAIALRQKRQR
jgi:hypothetical protein